jgi:hypothetical protein
MRKLFWFSTIWVAAALCALLFFWNLFGVWNTWMKLPREFWTDLNKIRTLGNLAGVWHNFSALAVFLLLAAALLVLGRMILKWLRFDFPSGCSQIVHSLALGLSLLFISFTGFGLLHLFKPATAWIFWAAALAGACFFAVKHCGDLHQAFRFEFPAGRLNRFLLTVILLILSYFVLVAFDPPAKYDEVQYNLFFPKEYIARNGFAYINEFGAGYASFPAYADAAFCAGMLLGWQHILPHLFGWLFFLVMALALASVARRFGLERKYAPLLVFSLFSSASVLIMFSTAKPDMMAAACGLLALDALLEWDQTRRPRFFILSAFYLGLSLGLKYTMLLLLPAFGLTVLYLLCGRGTTVKHVCKQALIYAAVVAAVFAPWLIRNLIAVGNPIFPFALSLFGGGGSFPYTLDQAAVWSEVAHEVKNSTLNLDFDLIGFWHLFFMDLGAWLPVFLVPYLALLGLGGLKEYPCQGLLLFFVEVSMLLSVFICSLAVRYYYLPFGLLLLACALAIQRLEKYKPRFGSLVAAAAGLFFMAACAFAWRCSPDTLEICARNPSPDENVRRWCPYGPAVDRLNRTLPANARILSMVAPLYYSEHYMVFLWFMNEYGGFYQCASAADFNRQLHKLSFTHLVFCADPGFYTFVPEGGARYRAFYARMTKFVSELTESGALIRKIRFKSRPGTPWPDLDVYEINNH